MIADRRYLAAQVAELQDDLNRLAMWIDNPELPFPGDSLTLAGKLRRVAELMVADANPSPEAS